MRMRRALKTVIPAPWLVILGMVALLSASSTTSAQILPPWGRTPAPAPTAPPPTPQPATPAPTAPPTSAPSPTPAGPVATPSGDATPSPGGADPTPTPAPTSDNSLPIPGLTPPTPRDPADPAAPAPAPGVSDGGVVDLPAEVEAMQVPYRQRTPGRNTATLVRILEGATRAGVPLEEALVDGMGRFPVAGLAWYSDDWHAPRFDPGSPDTRLHKGLDIFADAGTPIRSPDDGVVTRLSQSPRGGIGLWMRAADGTHYYFAHLQGYADDVRAGMRVRTGTVIGYVGDSGNARGGAPHLHFEVHRPAAIPPKPYVDEWLDEAIEAAPAWVEARIGEVLAERNLVRAEHAGTGLVPADAIAAEATPEYSLMLTLIDPVGGSVGMLPKLTVAPRRAAPAPERLIEEIVRLRVGGSVLGSFVGRHHH